MMEDRVGRREGGVWRERGGTCEERQRRESGRGFVCTYREVLDEKVKVGAEFGLSLIDLSLALVGVEWGREDMQHCTHHNPTDATHTTTTGENLRTGTHTKLESTQEDGIPQDALYITLLLVYRVHSGNFGVCLHSVVCRVSGPLKQL